MNDRLMCDFYDDLLGKGAGDPDFHSDPNKRWVGVDKPVVERHYDSTNRRDNHPDENADYEPNFDEDLEDIDE